MRSVSAHDQAPVATVGRIQRNAYLRESLTIARLAYVDGHRESLSVMPRPLLIYRLALPPCPYA